jgi:DNA-binding beta-propeller fold protein YncE
MVGSPQHPGEVRTALREIVVEYGPEVLSKPVAMSNLLKDMLPDAPKFARMLVTAAEDRIADVLRDHVSQGMDVATASRLTATNLTEATMLAPEACAWIVAEFAIALGLATEAHGPPTIVVPPSTGDRPSGRAPRPASNLTKGGSATEAASPLQSDMDHSGTQRGLTAYIAAHLCITPMDLATSRLGLPIRLGRNARAIVITPDGTTAYAVAGRRVIPISLAIRATGPPIKAGTRPAAIAITPDGATAYVVSGADGTITPISTATSTPGTAIRAGRGLTAIAITPDGTTAYVVAGNGWVMAVHLPSGACAAPIAVEAGLTDIAIDPDGRIAYVTGPRGVTPISIRTGMPGSPIKIQGHPSAIAITPAGTSAYVLAHGSAVIPIDLATSKPGTPISIGPRATGKPMTAGERPRAICITPDGTTAYVVNEGDGTVTPIDLSKGSGRTPIKVGPYAYAIAITR